MKNNNNNNNERKKNLVHNGLGYCPSYIVKRKFLYCKTRFVLQPRWLVQGENILYCKRVGCIAEI